MNAETKICFLFSNGTCLIGKLKEYAFFQAFLVNFGYLTVMYAGQTTKVFWTAGVVESMFGARNS